MVATRLVAWDIAADVGVGKSHHRSIRSHGIEEEGHHPPRGVRSIPAGDGFSVPGTVMVGCPTASKKSSERRSAFLEHYRRSQVGLSHPGEDAAELVERDAAGLDLPVLVRWASSSRP